MSGHVECFDQRVAENVLQSSPCALSIHDVYLFKTLRHHPCLLQKFRQSGGPHIFHHRQKHASSGFGIVPCVMMIECMANVLSQGVQLMVGKLRPDASGELAGAKIIKPRARQTKMFQGNSQMSDIECGVVRDDHVRVSQPFQKGRRDVRKLGCILDIKVRQAVTFYEIFAKLSVSPGWTHQPIRCFRQGAILKDGHAGGADACAGGIGRFKVNAGDDHRVLTGVEGQRSSLVPAKQASVAIGNRE